MYSTLQNAYPGPSSPLVWGPQMWKHYHSSAAKYPLFPSETTMWEMREMIYNIPNQLPCRECKNHAKQYIMSTENELNRALKSRSNLFEYFWKFHNSVNRRLNKPHVPLNVARAYYGL